MIQNILGLQIPIVRPENLPLGVDISHYNLRNLFDTHGFNFQYSIRDIVMKNNRGVWVSTKTDRKLLVKLAEPLWTSSNSLTQKRLESLKLSSFIQLFLQIWHYYFMKGTSQISVDDPLFVDLCNYKFYIGVNFKLAFTKIYAGPSTNGEADSLQLHTYGDVKEYFWQSPKLVLNNN